MQTDRESKEADADKGKLSESMAKVYQRARAFLGLDRDTICALAWLMVCDLPLFFIIERSRLTYLRTTSDVLAAKIEEEAKCLQVSRAVSRGRYRWRADLCTIEQWPDLLPADMQQGQLWDAIDATVSRVEIESFETSALPTGGKGKVIVGGSVDARCTVLPLCTRERRRLLRGY